MKSWLKNKATNKMLLCSTLLLSTAAFVQPTSAQTVPAEATGIADPGRAANQLRSDRVEPRNIPNIEIKEAQVQKAPDGAENVAFTLTSLNVEGSTVYSSEDLTRIVGLTIGDEITLADLYAAAARLTRTYRNDGYILTQVVIPPQTIEGGKATLRVIEGFINKIEIQSENQTDRELSLIEGYVERLTRQDVLTIEKLERTLLLLNDLPGLNARTVLKPSQDVVGGADVIVIVDRKAYDAEISIDNYGTKFLGPMQAGGSIAFNSLFNSNEQITVQGSLAPSEDQFSELFFGSISYKRPIATTGSMIEISASFAHTEPGYTLDRFDVNGYSSTISGEWSYPLIRSRSENLYGHISFDYAEIRSQNNINIDPTRKDHLRTARIGIDYDRVDGFFGGAYNVLGLEVSQGIDAFGANKKSQDNRSRPDSDPTFTKIKGNFTRLQRLDDKMNLLMSFEGQWASAELASTEEYGFGGANLGRGYDPSEVIGDDAIAGKVELQFNTPYKIDLFKSYQLYGFLDLGRVWSDDAASADAEMESLSSAGGGIRADFSDTASLGAMLAHPLSRAPQTQADKDPRFFINITQKF